MADQSMNRRNPTGKLPRRQRRTLSCLPCRLSKLKCDRVVPCQNCSRYGREDRCRLNPPPEASLASTIGHAATTVLPRMELDNPRTSKARLPPTPSSVAGDSARASDSSPFASHPTAEDRLGSKQFQFNALHFGHSSFPQIPEETTAQGLTVASAIISRSYNSLETTLLDEPALYWKRYLISILPSQTQCDMLVSYFFENINWIYQAVHAPSFRSEYAKFWTTEVAEVDLIWLALLYMILCLGALFIPSQMAEATGFEASDLPVLYQRWYSASRQALTAGGCDSKPTLTQIQVFLISQIYWYSTKNVEALNSHMAQAVRNAQALGLDKAAPATINSCLEREMRHRVWWDLVSSDTFQSLCLGRPTLLQSHLSNIPFPANCNDVDITPTAVRERPISEPTEMSVHCFRAQVFKIFNKLYINNGANLSSFAYVSEIDAELDELLETLPWYIQDDYETLRQKLSPGFASIITWMRHILHSCICIQRVRMYRPFLKPLIGDAWQKCVAASTSALTIYKSLRSPNISRFQRSQKMHVAAYQVFSAAVALSTFLLVEMPSNAEIIRADIELVTDDLQSHSITVDEDRRIPLIADGRRVIRRILDLYDARCRHALKASMAQDARSDSTDSAHSDDAPTALVPAIFSVFGGESSARRYLERCAIDYIVNDTSVVERPMSSSDLSTTILEMSAWDVFIDPGQWGHWGDTLWADLDSVLSTENDNLS